MLNLIVDIGNTRTKLALFDQGKLKGRVKIVDRLSTQAIKDFVKKRKIDAVCTSIVGKVPISAMRHLAKQYDLVNLDHNTDIPIRNSYKTPKTLGKDRLAAAIGAWGHYPKKPCLIFDAGTCVTYDLVTKAGEYLGGGISPGIHLRFRAMDTFTANLPLAKMKNKAKWLGANTIESLQAGAQWGLIHEIEGFIRQYRKVYPGLIVVATGGDADYLARNMKTKIFVHPNLVLEGLDQILLQYESNV